MLLISAVLPVWMMSGVLPVIVSLLVVLPWIDRVSLICKGPPLKFNVAAPPLKRLLEKVMMSLSVPLPTAASFTAALVLLARIASRNDKWPSFATTSFRVSTTYVVPLRSNRGSRCSAKGRMLCSQTRLWHVSPAFLRALPYNSRQL